MIKYEKETITNLLSEIKSAHKLLSELKAKDIAELKADPHLVGSAKYNFIVSIEAAIDICNHLISKNGYRVPDDYSDSFRILAEESLLSQDFVEERLVKMARFRNRLVHQYWKIDIETLYEILQNNLVDLEQFIKEIKKHF